MKNAAVSTKTESISPKTVRYIKLGRNGRWERECLKKGIMRYGYDAATKERYPICLGGEWKKLNKSFLAAGRSKGTATRFTNETRLFFEDDGSTLWITFVGECLYWGFVKADVHPRIHLDGDGVFRTIWAGWSCKDRNGEQLTKDRLAGSLTKVAAYQGTSCRVDVSDYAVRRINGQKTPEVERAIEVSKRMKTSALEMMGLLQPKDFELLVDLVFSTSGWRRIGTVGKTQKTLDFDLMLPSTGERAFVQVKSKTNSAQLAKYIEEFDDLGPYDKMFFVYHTGEARTDDGRVTVIGPEKLADLVLDSGLVNWLIRKVS